MLFEITYLQTTYDSAPCGTRTHDPRIRNPLLYPAELRALFYGLLHGCFVENTDTLTTMSKALASEGRRSSLNGLRLGFDMSTTTVIRDGTMSADTGKARRFGGH